MQTWKEHGDPEFLSKLDALNIPILNPTYPNTSDEVRRAKVVFTAIGYLRPTETYRRYFYV